MHRHVGLPHTLYCVDRLPGVMSPIPASSRLTLLILSCNCLMRVVVITDSILKLSVIVKEEIMALWWEWTRCVWSLRAACSREITFFWMVVALLGMSVRADLAGVTSFVRAGFIDQAYYRALLNLFHSPALGLDPLLSLWVNLSMRLFTPVMENGFVVFVADGIKAAKEGKKMPGVKSLHQESADNSKPPYIMGHSFQVIGLLVQGLAGAFAAVRVADRCLQAQLRPVHGRRVANAR